MSSFFVKSKSSDSSRFKKNGILKSKKRKSKALSRNEEITSSEDEELPSRSDEANIYPSEDELETAQEKKLRLAKVYLEEIDRQERQRLEDKDIDKAVISKRLKEDYLKQIGRFRSKVAAKYKQADVENALILNCKLHRNAITCLCISSDDQYLYSGSKDAAVVKWSLETGKKISNIAFTKINPEEIIIGHSNKITCIAISTDNKFLVVVDESPDIQIWNPENFKHIRTLKGHRKSVTGACFKRDTHILYTCSQDKSVKVWSLDEMSYIETLYGHQSMITGIDTLYRDRVITSGGGDSTLRLWKIPEESQLIYNGSGSVDVVRLINEENFVSGSDNGDLCIWSFLKKRPVCTVEKAHGVDSSNGMPYSITSVASLLNSDLVASGSCNGSIKLWKLGEKYRSMDLLFELPIIGFVNSMLFTSDGNKLIVSTAKEHRFGRWNVIKQAKNHILLIPLIK